MENTYNGWKNRETWNVSLWINNDEGLYRAAVDFMENTKAKAPYKDFIASIGLEHSKTPDGIAYISTKLDYNELNAMMRDLID